MSGKQVDKYIEKTKNMSLKELEREILKLYPVYTRGKSTEKLKIRYCLDLRKHILNSNFKFTPAQVKQIEKVNQLLTDATAKILKKAEVLDRQMLAIKAAGDDFLEDYYIEAELTIEYLDEDSIWLLDEDENEGQSDYQAMVAVLSEMFTLPLRFFHFYDKGNEESTETDDKRYEDNMLNFDWDEEELGATALKHIPYFCYASHLLFCDSTYSFSDIIRIKSFINEINVRWENRIKC
jgi:hypothetical protein